MARSGDVMFFADRYEIPVITPREPERRAGIVALAPAPQDTAPLAASLANHGLTVTVRSGKRPRWMVTTRWTRTDWRFGLKTPTK